MRLLEDLPQLEDNFEMVLSRKVSVNTEFDDTTHKYNSAKEYEHDLFDQLPEKVRIFTKMFIDLVTDFLMIYTTARKENTQ